MLTLSLTNLMTVQTLLLLDLRKPLKKAYNSILRFYKEFKRTKQKIYECNNAVISTNHI